MDSTRQFVRGERILAKTLDGEVQRVVWEDHGDSVRICSERQYEALSKGLNAPMPIGFPKSDIKLIDS